jgi:hypothetical protein
VLFVAGCLIILLGLIHSVLGETLIFKHMRDGGIVPTNGGSQLRERHLRIVWATWHLVSVFGWGIGTILCWFALSSSRLDMMPSFVLNSLVITLLVGSSLVLFGTRGKHPGWLVLMAIALLSWFGV